MIDVDLLDTTYQEIITTFVLNKMLHHVGMIWIIENQEELKYDMDILNSDWLLGRPRYNTSICKKLLGKLFEGFIIDTRNDMNNIMCSIDAYEREHKSPSCDDGSSSGGCPVPITSTIEALESICAHTG